MRAQRAEYPEIAGVSRRGQNVRWGWHTVLPDWSAVRDRVDYTLRWPHQIVADELHRLVALADSEGVTTEWIEEASILLRQAFVTDVPAEDFERIRAAASIDPIYGDEEPF